jgi:predicted nucleotidyltransferase
MDSDSSSILTVAERKARKAARKKEAVRAVIERLRAFVGESGSAGRFVVFGSAVSGPIRYDSDFDVIIDFPADREAEAWRAVEDACDEWDIEPDILTVATTTPAFLEKIMKRPTEIIA